MDSDKTSRMILEEKAWSNDAIQTKFVHYLKQIQVLEGEIVSISNNIVETYDMMVDWNQKKPITDYDEMLKHNMMLELHKQLESYIKTCSKKKSEILQMLLVLQNYAEQYLKNSRSNLCYSKDKLMALQKRAQTSSFKRVKFPSEILRNTSTPPPPPPRPRRMSDSYSYRRF